MRQPITTHGFWRALCVGASTLLAAVPLLATAAESNLAVSPHAVVSLVGESATVAPGQAVRIGLHQRLAPH